MKITRLVILFNYKKILIGIIISLFSYWFSKFLINQIAAKIFYILSVLIILNIILSIIASYILYDKSDLYKLEKLPEYIKLSKIKNEYSFMQVLTRFQKILKENIRKWS